MSWPHLTEPADLFGPDAHPAALSTTVRLNNVMRLCGCPLARRGELLTFMRAVEPVEPETAQMGALWRWKDVVKAMRKRGQQFIPDQFRQAAAVP